MSPRAARKHGTHKNPTTTQKRKNRTPKSSGKRQSMPMSLSKGSGAIRAIQTVGTIVGRLMGTGGGQKSNVFSILENEHRKLEKLFSEFEKADTKRRSGIAHEALTTLEIHTAVEEEIVYPAINRTIKDEGMIDEAREEHHVVKFLIHELHKMSPGSKAYAPKFKVLGELVQHHAKEEEREMFPEAESHGIDSQSLAKQVIARQARLEQKYGKRTKAA
ncbi:hypothetical protein W02_16380 [Nitrospira sp. KM1]|uniref:hemerythrin domain-containing protein n=1 Tax=Nitrospira sp. KM1 TaxID=1936990 RepID=UPI0013A78014|nr:hemerythrin domain-containing protein [Nitrospira sp. KM1]BCA54498.1 hypothetical protein W02_16380 [Nitrospira sp. KM1]